jgi:hypothetical protein
MMHHKKVTVSSKALTSVRYRIPNRLLFLNLGPTCCCSYFFVAPVRDIEDMAGDPRTQILAK